MTTGLDHHLRPGDILVIWPFDAEVHRKAFPVVPWQPGTRQELARQCHQLFQRLPFRVPVDWKRAQNEMRRAVQEAGTLRVVLVTDNKRTIQGTPFDAEVNSAVQDEHDSNAPAVISFLAQGSRLVDWAVTPPGGRVVMPRPGPRPLSETNQVTKAKPRSSEANPSKPAKQTETHSVHATKPEEMTSSQTDPETTDSSSGSETSSPRYESPEANEQVATRENLIISGPQSAESKPPPSVEPEEPSQTDQPEPEPAIAAPGTEPNETEVEQKRKEQETQEQQQQQQQQQSSVATQGSTNVSTSPEPDTEQAEPRPPKAVDSPGRTSTDSSPAPSNQGEPDPDPLTATDPPVPTSQPETRKKQPQPAESNNVVRAPSTGAPTATSPATEPFWSRARYLGLGTLFLLAALILVWIQWNRRNPPPHSSFITQSFKSIESKEARVNQPESKPSSDRPAQSE
jgi:hypothetical protein